MKKFKLIIFDMDGVVIDSERFYDTKIINRFKELNIEIDVGELNSVKGTNRKVDIDIFNKSNKSNDYVREQLTKIVKESEDELRTFGAPLKQGVYEFIDKLKQNNFVICVATSTRFELAKSMLEKVNIYDKFDFIVSSNDVKRAKPFPDIFIEACKKGKVNYDEALVIEDSNAGCLAAKEAGIAYVSLIDTISFEEEIKESAILVTDSFTDIYTMIERI